jgi:hypothetical protein
MVMIKSLDLEKKKEKIKWTQGKDKIHRAILFW